MATRWEEYNKSFLCDGIRFMCGEKIGRGMSREVFVYDGNDEYVVKVEVYATSYFQNVMEYNFWDAVRRDPDKLKWIAPCNRISPHGNFLVQERTYPVTLAELKKKVPKVPVWAADLKESNWGKLPNGRIVCHDYGTHNAVGQVSNRLRKAQWWS